MAEAPLRSKVRHYSRLKAMACKLRKLTDDFQWGRVDALLEGERGRALVKVAAQ
jgi:hypothetical protein